MIIAIFIIFLIFLIWASHNLLKISEQLSENTRITNALLGFLFISIITSLPELSTSLGANLLGNEPDMAFSDIIGSNAFNFGTLFFLFFLFNIGFKTCSSCDDNRYFRSFIFLLVYYGLFLALSLRKIGGYSLVVSLLFIASYIYIIYRYNEYTSVGEGGSISKTDPGTKRQIILKFIFYSLCVIGAGILLSLTGKRISVLYGLSSSFIGALFLAISTSMPELTVSFFAFRNPRTVDIGIANVIGSNLFNINIIAINDLWHRRSFYSTITGETSQLIMLNILLTLYILFFSALRRNFRLWAMLGTALYLVGFAVIYFN